MIDRIPEHRARHPLDPRGRPLLLLLGAPAVLLAVVAVLWLAFFGNSQEGQKEQAQAETKDLATQVKEKCDAGGEPARRLGDLCQRAKEIVERPGPRGPIGVQGQRGPQGPGPSAAQVQNAVAAYCAARVQCKGPDGKIGPAGQNATPVQVAAAVASYCNARGECIGPTGRVGDTGADGERGPGPTDAQVATAVSTYCAAHDDCRGPQGVPGADSTVPGPGGSTGPAGRGIASVACDSKTQVSFTFTFTDGTTSTITCGGPEPTPPAVTPG